MKLTTTTLLLLITFALVSLVATEEPSSSSSCSDHGVKHGEPMGDGGHLNFQSDPTVDYANSPSGPTLLDLIPKAKSLTIFSDLVYKYTDLVELLSNVDLAPKVTFFVPTNVPLKQYLTANESGRVVLNDVEKLQYFLGSYIAPVGKLDATALATPQTLETLSAGNTIAVGVREDGKVVLNERAVVDLAHPVEGANGIMYMIDSVLI